MQQYDLINIITSCEETGKQWKCLLENVLGFRTVLYDPYHAGQASQNMLDASLWIMEVWNSDVSDPVGFRNALSLAGSNRILLVFNKIPEKNFPEEGNFWITYSFTESIKDKIDFMLSQKPIKKAQFERLLEKYPDLGKKPEKSHHH